MLLCQHVTSNNRTDDDRYLLLMICCFQSLPISVTKGADMETAGTENEKSFVIVTAIELQAVIATLGPGTQSGTISSLALTDIGYGDARMRSQAGVCARSW